jgi:hypothetical protein
VPYIKYVKPKINSDNALFPLEFCVELCYYYGGFGVTSIRRFFIEKRGESMISYKKLWKILIDKDMKKKRLGEDRRSEQLHFEQAQQRQERHNRDSRADMQGGRQQYRRHHGHSTRPAGNDKTMSLQYERV